MSTLKINPNSHFPFAREIKEGRDRRETDRRTERQKEREVGERQTDRRRNRQTENLDETARQKVRQTDR